MPRRRKSAGVAPSLLGVGSDSSLKKQSRYGQKPWLPGEIPTRSGSLMPITSPLDDAPQPYGEFMAVQKPSNRGQGYSPIAIVDFESHVTERKQTSGAHGVKKL